MSDALEEMAKRFPGETIAAEPWITAEDLIEEGDEQ